MTRLRYKFTISLSHYYILNTVQLKVILETEVEVGKMKGNCPSTRIVLWLYSEKSAKNALSNNLVFDPFPLDTLF